MSDLFLAPLHWCFNSKFPLLNFVGLTEDPAGYQTGTTPQICMYRMNIHKFSSDWEILVEWVKKTLVLVCKKETKMLPPSTNI